MKTLSKHRLMLPLALSTMLAGCGGGDGGGGVTSTPTAPPAQAAARNTSLTGTLVSESFLNSAAFAAISLPANGAAPTTSAGTASLTIAYDAAKGTYTLSDGSRSLSVSAANIDKTRSNAAVTSYVTASQTTSDSLTLANNGTGSGQTQYVGAGLWLHQVNNNGSVDGQVTGLAYGAQTSFSALPRSGSASYNVNLLGLRNGGTTIYALGGNGLLNVDFGAGAVYASGTYSETNSSTGTTSANHGWASQARLSGTSNALVGQIQLDSAGSGGWQGAFYGPSAQEVGSTWSSKSGSDIASAGVIWGAQGTAPLNVATNLAAPESDGFYKPLTASFSATVASGSGALTPVGVNSDGNLVYHVASSGQDVIYASDRITVPATGIAPLTYQQFGTDLIYSRGAVEIDTRNGGLAADAYVYGIDTKAGAIPRTGSADYAVTLNGAVALNGQPLRGIAGSGVLSANFANFSLTTQGSYTLTDPTRDSYANARSPLDRGTWNGSATINSAANAFLGNAAFDSNTTADFSTSLSGKFFGPAAQEVGASVSGSATDGSRLAAAMTGTQSSTLSGALGGLASLTGATVLSGRPAVFNGSSNLSSPGLAIGSDMQTTWDATAQSYRFKSSASGESYAIDKTFLNSDRVAAQSDATYTAYHNASGDVRVLNTGAGNPLIALTYSSFAEITSTSGAMNAPTVWYVPFGAPTPASQIPQSGSATYNGVVVGRGGGAGGANASDLSGTSTLALDFATYAATMSMALTATNRSSGAVQSVGTVNWTGSMGNSGPGSSQNTLAAYPTTQGASGSLVGMLYGANAAEFGGAFNLQISNAGAGQASSFSGAVMAKKVG